MGSRKIVDVLRGFVLLCALPVNVFAQQPPYDVYPPADPPYYRVRYSRHRMNNRKMLNASCGAIHVTVQVRRFERVSLI